MNNKRVISGFLCIFVTLISIVFGNQYFIDGVFGAIALIAIHEFYSIFKGKAKPVKWIGYLAAFSIFFIHIIPNDSVIVIAPFIIPFIIIVLFLQIIITNSEINFYDIAITFLGVCYIVVFTMFIPMVRALNNGHLLMLYIVIAAWVTDMFAYYVGKNFGKHKFTRISPNKTIEGCVGGAIGAIIISILYTVIVNKVFGLNIGYLYIVIVSALSSIIAQVGDLAASSIKRYTNVKDFGNLIPGHGGILDRFDSMIFIAPFMYAILSML